MIILDTNVISELMKSSPSERLIEWLDNQDSAQLYISTVTIAEIAYGIDALPIGNRRKTIEAAFGQVLNEGFKHRIYSFDEASAFCYGKIMARRKSIGRPLSVLDGQIAAIAYANAAAVATRNIRDFVNCEVDLINPFVVHV